jgi:predicted Rossmann-fold nucleotide-binding protein
MRSVHIVLCVCFYCAPVLAGTATVHLSPSICSEPRPVLNPAIRVPAELLARDAYCVQNFMDRVAPQGIVFVFGGSKIQEGSAFFQSVKQFAFLWTKKVGKRYPIGTAGGEGVMAAANRGAREAGGKSIAFVSSPNLHREPNTFVTDSYTFASMSQCESEMIDRAAAILFAPGGVGTEWEIFETLSKIKYGRKTKVPIVFLGSERDWETLTSRLNHMREIGTISAADVGPFQFSETAEQTLSIFEREIQR